MSQQENPAEGSTIRGHLKRLSAQTLVYGLGDAVTRLAGLILLPVYTHLLSPDDYGRIAIVTLVTTLVTIVLDFGQRSAFFRFYYLDENRAARRRLTGTVLIYLLVSAVLVLLPLVLLVRHGGLPFVRDESIRPLLAIALLGSFFDVGSVVPFAIFRAEQRALQYAALSAVRFVISLSLNIVAVVIFRWGVSGVILANLVTSVLFFAVCLVLTRGALDWTVDPGLLRRLLRFGLPLVPANLSGWVLSLSDRFFLERFADLGQVGVYAVGCSVAGILNMVLTWFNIAWVPYSLSVAKQDGARDFYARILTYVMAASALIGICINAGAFAAIRLLAAPAYHGAVDVVPFIAGSYILYELFYVLSLGFDLTGKTQYHFWIVGTAAVVNIALNLALVPTFGMMGAAAASVISYAFLPLVEYPIVRRFYRVEYEWPRLLKLGGVTAGMLAAGSLFRTGGVAADVCLCFAVAAVFGALLYVLGFFEAGEISAMKSAADGGIRETRAFLRRVITKTG